MAPGTLMGNLFRQYWLPVVPVEHLAEPGGRPLRLKLLGEDLVLFRQRSGQVGLIDADCSHRLGPLFFGRVEADGISVRTIHPLYSAARQRFRSILE
jgi:phthalate 4,5-dioxygenase